MKQKHLNATAKLAEHFGTGKSGFTEKEIADVVQIVKSSGISPEVCCGDANPNGSVELSFLGRCMKKLDMKDAYRCTGCGGWFHRDCIFAHFELENGCSKAHNALRKIKDCCSLNFIQDLCDQGLDRSKEQIKLNIPK